MAASCDGSVLRVLHPTVPRLQLCHQDTKHAIGTGDWERSFGWKGHTLVQASPFDREFNDGKTGPES